MSNNLPPDKQIMVVNALVEGCSIRSTERMTGVNRETIGTLLVRLGNGCSDLLNETMRELDCGRLEIDELWAFVGKKQRHVTAEDDKSRVNDTWTFVAIDGDTKLIPSFLVGKRDAANTNVFIDDVARRMKSRVQVTTDGLRTYVDAIGCAFAEMDVDYAQLHKMYEAEATGPGRYSPPKVISTEKVPVFGEPQEELVSTSYVERQNLTVRMGVRRHQTLRVTPCMAAGLTQTMWSTGELLEATIDGVRS